MKAKEFKRLLEHLIDTNLTNKKRPKFIAILREQADILQEDYEYMAFALEDDNSNPDISNAMDKQEFIHDYFIHYVVLNKLCNSGIDTIDKLLEHSGKDLLKVDGISKTEIFHIKACLARKGLSLKADRK